MCPDGRPTGQELGREAKQRGGSDILILQNSGSRLLSTADGVRHKDVNVLLKAA